MRVGVDYRILAVGNGLIRRGLGRFTQQQLRAVLALDPANEYVLICPPGANRFLIDAAVRRAPNVSIRHLPVDLVPAIGDGWPTRLQRAEQFERWVLDQGIDVYHATTPFYPCEPMLSTFDACPMVATFYDAIPLLYPAHYFLGPADKSIYAFALSILRAATRVIAISDASRQDAVDLVGVPRERVDLAYPVVDGIFGPMAARDVDRTLARLSRRVRVPSRFAFTVSFPHHSKNMENLLRAYALLPESVRLRLPLVAACTVPEAGTVVWPLSRALGISDDVVLLSEVTDDELVALYNRATFVVHPSRYEGFGLPVAEAMRCGTPVITTTSSSLPEIAGGAAVLVDPDDVDGMAAAMLDLDGNEAARADLAGRGLVQSARFGEDQLARSTLDCYRRAVTPPATSAPRRPRLAVWSPLPPAGGSSAATTVDLLDELAGSCDVEVFVGDGAQPAWRALGRRPVHHASAFDRRLAQAGFDAVVYSVDATPDHLYVGEAAALSSGIAEVHCPSWSRVRLESAGQAGSEARAALEAAGGPAARAELATDAGPESGFWDRYPLLDGVLDASLAALVHDPVVAAALARRYPGVRVVEVPLGVKDDLGDDLDVRRKAVRAALGCDEDAFVVALFADGASEAAVQSVRRAIALVDGALLPTDWQDVDRIAACDVAVVVPTGRSSTHAQEVRALAAGRPVVNADPRPAGGFDTSDLVAELRALEVDPDLRARRGAEARERFERDHALPHAAAAYLGAIAAVTGRTIDARPDAGTARRPDPWDEIVRTLAG